MKRTSNHSSAGTQSDCQPLGMEYRENARRWQKTAVETPSRPLPFSPQT
jgi:hypothetical protein